jgi:5-methylcytosine-specific restriction endonuclease McrA
MPTRPPIHRPPGWRSEQARRAANDADRGTSTQRGYDAEWRRFRERIIAAHPYCSTPGCGSTDRLNVDHIETVREAPDRRLDPTNVRVLCHSCHSARTSRDHSWNA